MLSDDHNSGRGVEEAWAVAKATLAEFGAVGLAAVAVELSLQLASALERIAAEQGIAAVDLADVWFVDSTRRRLANGADCSAAPSIALVGRAGWRVRGQGRDQRFDHAGGAGLPTGGCAARACSLRSWWRCVRFVGG